MASKKVENVRMCKGHNAPALNCLGQMKESDFYTSWSNFSDGKVPYCKSCIQKIFKYYLKETQTEKTALYFTLMKLDIPFIQEIFDIVVNKSNYNVDKLVGTYIVELQRKTQNKEIWCDFSSSDIELKDIDSKIQTVAERKSELKDLEYKWGIQDCVEDYDFLEDNFKRYTADLEDEDYTPSRIDLVKDLCNYRLILRKINDNRYNGEISQEKCQSQISNLLKILKLDNFEEKKPLTLSEQLIFNKIAQIELTKPADLYKEPKKYKDFNKVKKYYEDICLRPLKNCLLGAKDFNIDMENLSQYDLEEDNG